MNKEIQNRAMYQRQYKILILFGILVLLVSLFLYSVLGTISSDRRIPSHNSTIHDRSLRGAIISADNYTLSRSHKTYQAVVRGASIKKEKRELFIKLFSIYSGISKESLHEKFKMNNGELRKGNIILSKTINSRSAMQLKSLAYKLRKLSVFQTIEIRPGVEVLYGLDLIENGEKREFPLKDIMSPILGYVGNQSDGRYTRPEGKKGLERNYDKHITSKKNGYFKGKRDVVGAVIHDKNSIKMQRVDGMDLHLNIPLAFQRRVELMIDNMKTKIDADEIIVGVIESKTGKVLSLASSQRYDSSHIMQKDIAALVPKFTEYPYEAGSVLKPITLAIALDHKVVKPNTWFDTFNGRMKIGKRRTITDDEKFKGLTATDIIVHSSNVGISQISWKLTGREFREGLLKFGIAKSSGLDLSRDLPGQLKPLYKLDHKMHRANSSYGYGMMVTFMQLLKAYSAFNNDGVALTPRIVDYLQDAKGNHYTLEPEVSKIKAIGKKAANQIHDILIEVVKRGTGVKAQYPGLEVGGKTGTAHIAKNGRYVREYHSSFYGFANDKKGNKYTIGALVIRAKKPYKYFASQSAVPTFRNIVQILVNQGNLIPDLVAQEEQAQQVALYAIEEENLTREMDRLPIEITDDSVEKRSVKALFGIPTKPQKKSKPVRKRRIKPKPRYVPAPKPTLLQMKSTHDQYDDLF